MDAGTWFTQLNAWQVMLLGLVFFGGIYLLGGLLMSTLTSGLSRLGVGQVLDTHPLKPDQLGREWRQSFHSILVFGLGMIVPWGFLQLGWAHLTPDVSAGRIALEIAVLLIWNDVHFWINHRLLHTRKLMRYHGDHHRSVVTTPWSTYSFHPIEALMLGNIILLPMVVHDFYFWSLASVPVLSLILNLIRSWAPRSRPPTPAHLPLNEPTPRPAPASHSAPLARLAVRVLHDHPAADRLVAVVAWPQPHPLRH
ncbi:MAG: sterol desaturase family protein [Comamonas sp.]